MVEETKVEVATPKALKKALEHEKTPELAAKLDALRKPLFDLALAKGIGIVNFHDCFLESLHTKLA